MKIGNNAHLTYCMNIHPGEHWPDVTAARARYATAVQNAVDAHVPFGIGLRLSALAARELVNTPGQLAIFRDQLSAANQYVFTINGFPYGPFHGTRVKESVYEPDWSHPERTKYTCQLAECLAAWQPPDREGSISTVPGGYRTTSSTPCVVEAMVVQLMETVCYLAELADRSGYLIHIGLEPEPGCLLETTADTCRFFEEQLLRNGAPMVQRRTGWSRSQAEERIRQHLGVCLDTCHAALQFEDPAEALIRYQQAGIRLSKVQISAALESDNGPGSQSALAPFVEPVYLHQVRLQDTSGTIHALPDLPQGLDQLPALPVEVPVRVHFHVPLFWEGAPPLRSTSHTLTSGFWQQLRSSNTRHLEIETYTFDVLPPPLRTASVTDHIVAEYRWVLERMTRDSNDSTEE